MNTNEANKPRECGGIRPQQSAIALSEPEIAPDKGEIEVNNVDETREVTVNCRVTVRGFEPPDEEETFWIVADGEANPQENKLPASSPLAQALIGAHVGNQVPFHPPGGKVELTIVDVDPA